ncbi:hypothetical protein AD947_00510, partial [Acetobacter tropicalis]
AVFAVAGMLGRPFFAVSWFGKRQLSADLAFSAFGKVIQIPFSDCGFRRCRYAGKTLFQQADSLEAAVFCQYGDDDR